MGDPVLRLQPHASLTRDCIQGNTPSPAHPAFNSPYRSVLHGKRAFAALLKINACVPELESPAMSVRICRVWGHMSTRPRQGVQIGRPMLCLCLLRHNMCVGTLVAAYDALDEVRTRLLDWRSGDCMVSYCTKVWRKVLQDRWDRRRRWPRPPALRRLSPCCPRVGGGCARCSAGS